MAFGISFLGDNEDAQAPNGEQDQYQEAIRILNLRLPKIVGGQGIAPAPLLQAPGAMGMAPSAVGPQGGPMAPMVPTPRLIPGGQNQPPNPVQQALARMAGMALPSPRVVPGTQAGASVPQLPQIQRQFEPPIQPRQDGFTPAAAPEPSPFLSRHRERYGDRYGYDVSRGLF